MSDYMPTNYQYMYRAAAPGSLGQIQVFFSGRFSSEMWNKHLSHASHDSDSWEAWEAWDE